MHCVAEAGRLAIEETRAVQLIHATGRGVTLMLIGLSSDVRDVGLSELAREATIDAITPRWVPARRRIHGLARRRVSIDTSHL